LTRARRIAASLLAIVLTLAALLAWQWRDRPSLERLAGHALPALLGDPPAGSVTVTWLGVTTLLFDDGETALLTDGFFSRPGALAVATRSAVTPDPARIAAGLARAGVKRLAAVLVVHSHYDHVMDAPEVARRTGALVVGSRSTAQVARGWGLPEEQILEVEPGRPHRFGAFEVTFLSSRHVPLPAVAAGLLGREIEEPLVPPVPVSAYLEGGSYTILVAHPRGSALVQGSAGYLEGALEGHRADVVLLGVGGLGRQGRGYQERYWRHVVRAVGASRVAPIHWDDFTRPLDAPLVPFPRRVDDLGHTLDFLFERAAADDVALVFLPSLERVQLFPTAESGPAKPVSSTLAARKRLRP
jgi:L-ascorbate metabolism protein UlaG (beta-lactamase superfamily)